MGDAKGDCTMRNDRGGRMTDCPLCKLVFENDVHTHVLYNGTYWVITICDTCQVPMAVRKEHTVVCDNWALEELLAIWEDKMPARKFRMNMRKILDHLHIHFV